jgi:hypothetical protein
MIKMLGQFSGRRASENGIPLLMYQPPLPTLKFGLDIQHLEMFIGKGK